MNMEATIYDLLLLPLLLFILALVTFHFLHKPRLLNLPPTPFPALPVLGHLYLFLFFPYLPFHRALSRISRRHGPLLFLHFGSRPLLLVSSPALAQQCFTQNDVVFANRPNYLLNGKHFGYNFTSLAWSPYGHHWRNLRSISALHLLSSHKLTALAHVRAEEVQCMILKLFKGNKLYVDMRKMLFEHMYNVVTGMIRAKARGSGAGEEEAEAFREIVGEMTRVTLVANAVDFMPILRCVGLGKVAEWKMRSVQEKRDKFMENVLRKWQREDDDDDDDNGRGGVQKDNKSLIEVLQELKRNEPDTYTEETIRNLLLVLIQGASHASANTVEWAFSRLLHNPEILTKARSEIDNVVGEHRVIKECDMARLPYLRHIMKETLRMHPATPLLTPHASSEECRVGDYRVPEGTMLLVNVWEIHNNPRVWKEAEKFKPERFEGEEEGNYRYGAFGWGRRGCPGEKLAIEMVGVALGCLIQCFDWERIDQEMKTETETETEMWMREGRGVIIPRALPLKAKCIPRPFLSNLFLSSSKS